MRIHISFIVDSKNHKYLVYWASGLIDVAANENDQAKTIFNYNTGTFFSPG